MYRAGNPTPHDAQQQRPVSKTDVLLFKQLANPTRTVVPDSASKLMQNLQISAAAPAMPTFPPKMMMDRSGRPGAGMSRGGPPPNRFVRGGNIMAPPPAAAGFMDRRPYPKNFDDDEDISDDDDEDISDEDDDGLDDDDTSIGGGGGNDEPGRNKGYYHPGEGDDENSTPISNDPSAPPMMMTGSRENVFDNVPMPSEDILDPEAERMQRQMYIQNLRQFQADGHVLSISLNDDTPTSALRSEFEVIQESIETTRGVKQLIMGVFVAIKIIEGLNKLVLRNMLPIDGLADHLKDNCSQELMIPLRRIHNMYFRNSFGNPFVQLGTAIAFSSISYMLSQDTGIISNLFSGVMSMLSPGAAAAGGQQQQAPPRQTAPPPMYQQQQQPARTTPFAMGSGFTAGGNNGFAAAPGSGPSAMHKAPMPNQASGSTGVTPVSFPSAFTRKIQPPGAAGVQLGPKDKIPFQ